MSRQKNIDSVRYEWGYKKWHAMMRRASGKTGQLCYSDCAVDVAFKSYEGFIEWATNQVGYGFDGYQLDKDIIVKGNKIYGPEYCCFVPSHVNRLFIRGGVRRGAYPVGVYCKHKKYSNFSAELSVGGKKVLLGLYKTPEEAFNVYKKAKEDEMGNRNNVWNP